MTTTGCVRALAAAMLVSAIVLVPFDTADARGGRGGHGGGGPGGRGFSHGHGGHGHGGHGHRGHFHGHRGHFHGGVFVGVGPWWGWGGPGWYGSPYWSGAPYYSYAPSYVYSPPPVYIQRAPAYWYYCASAGGYYPTVPTCPEAWIPVPGS